MDQNDPMRSNLFASPSAAARSVRTVSVSAQWAAACGKRARKWSIMPTLLSVACRWAA